MSNSRSFDLDANTRWLNEMASQPIWDSWSNELFPKNMEKALYWGNWLRTHNGDLVSAVRRGICYWLNGVEITGSSDDLDSKDYYTDLLEHNHKILQQVLSVGLDLQFYGNSFTTAIRSITRVLECPKCHGTRYLRTLKRGNDYDFKNGEFYSTCSCHYSGKFNIKDYPNNNDDKPIRIVHWNPLAISLDHCSITGAEKIIYTPTASDASFIDNEAESAALETIPESILRAITADKSFAFGERGCLHLSLTPDAMNSDNMKGWGVPSFLPSFKYVIMLMLLERQTEAAVKDFILPIRLLFPSPNIAKGGSDPTGMATNVIHMNQFKSSIENALRSQAFQQSSWQLIPSAVEQLQLGGDGKAIIPVDVLRYAKEQLLDSMCIPVEFYTSSFNINTGVPTSLRMFEQTWEREVNLMDDYINWYLIQCKELLGWPEFTGSLMRQSITTDPNRMQLMLQMMGEGKISQTTVLRGLNINPKQERSRILEDQISEARLQQNIEKKLQAMGMFNDISAQQLNQDMQNAAMAAQGGGDPSMQGGVPADPAMQGGAPMPAPVPGMSTGDPMMDIQNLQSVVSPNNTSPDQLQADAQTVASILMSTPVGSPRNQVYSLVKRLNPTLYAVSKDALQKIENQAKQQGLEQARQGQ